MLDAAIAWTRQHTRRRVMENPLTGRVVDSYDLPPVAVREVLANALVHRDLGEWALSRAVELRVTDERMTVTNPGGLLGVRVDRLGHHQLSSARNMHLLRMCQFVGMADGNAVEALATGTPKILAATAAAGTLVVLRSSLRAHQQSREARTAAHISWRRSSLIAPSRLVR